MHIVITLAGHSRRFNAAGYEGPKALLSVGDQPMIQHVVNMFAPQDHFHFVINQNQAEQYSQLEGVLQSLAPKVSITVIPPHELGPVYSAMQVESIDDSDPVIISYNDFIVDWNYPKFLREVYDCDGAVVSFRGFHPASFGSTYYAYMRVDGNQMLELREKKSFTDNRSEEHASAGIYYFSNWKLFKGYGQSWLDGDDKTLPEAYVSLLYNRLVQDNLDVRVYDVDRFICLGTPEDYTQFQYWWTYFHRPEELQEPYIPQNPPTRINLIPMAGKGARFREYGYRVAKPLIKVRSTPMVIRTAHSMPQADRWIFLPSESDVNKYPIERNLREFYPDCNVIPVKSLTSGQAATCLLAENALHAEAELMIASCDYEHLYDSVKWKNLISDPDIDGAIWTYRMNSAITKNPKAFAYCRVGDDGQTILEIVEKNTISDSPEKDPLVVGTFWYRRAKDFVSGAQDMIEKNITVNGEHYVGTSINQLIEEGKHFVIFDVEQWISFGDPFELRVFEFWEDYFHYNFTQDGGFDISTKKGLL